SARASRSPPASSSLSSGATNPRRRPATWSASTCTGCDGSSATPAAGSWSPARPATRSCCRRAIWTPGRSPGWCRPGGRRGRGALAGDDPSRAADLLGAALDLWRGAALADVPATALVAAEADRLEESRVQALELRLEADLGCGRHGEAAPQLRRLVADHPLREGLWGLLMRALAGAGRPAEALGTYAPAREGIADQRGAD